MPEQFCTKLNLQYNAPYDDLALNLFSQAPANILSPSSTILYEPVISDESFALECSATGNKRTITWRKVKGNGDGRFKSQIDSEEEANPGQTKYGQSTVLSSKWQWIAPGSDSTCETVTRHDETYRCTADATAGGEDTTDVQDMSIKVQYKSVNVDC